jgi:hypothetical protein
MKGGRGNFVTKKFFKNLKQMSNYAARWTGSIHPKRGGIQVLACTAASSQIVKSFSEQFMSKWSTAHEQQMQTKLESILSLHVGSVDFSLAF